MSPKPTDVDHLIEAEDMAASPLAWEVLPFRGVDGSIQLTMFGDTADSRNVPSNLLMLQGSSSTAGTATQVVNISHAGDWILWVRFVTVDGYAFTVSALRSGLPPTQKHFPEGPDSPARFTWGSMELPNLSAGPCEIQIDKAGDLGVTSWRVIDCLFLTQDKSYVPKDPTRYQPYDPKDPNDLRNSAGVLDFVTPVFLRVLLVSTSSPSGLELLWDRSNTCVITKAKGGWDCSSQHEPNLTPGDSSDWVLISPYLKLEGDTPLRFKLEDTTSRSPEESEYAITLSPTASPDSNTRFFGTFTRKGKGTGMTVLIDVNKPDAALSDAEWSGQCLAWPGRRPPLALRANVLSRSPFPPMT